MLASDRSSKIYAPPYNIAEGGSRDPTTYAPLYARLYYCRERTAPPLGERESASPPYCPPPSPRQPRIALVQSDPPTYREKLAFRPPTIQRCDLT